MDISRTQIEMAIGLDENDLLAVIGHFNNDELHGFAPSKDELIKLGNKWIKENRENLKDVLCNKESVKNFTVKSDNAVDFVLLLCDSMATLKLNFPVVAIASWILKKGLSTLCNDTWTQ